MKDQNEATVCDLLIERIPEFKEYKDFKLWNKDLPYLYFGVFADFIVSRINLHGEPLRDEIVKRSFSFLDEMINSENNGLGNLASVSVLEVLAENQLSIKVARRLLTKEALFEFDRMLDKKGIKVN